MCYKIPANSRKDSREQGLSSDKAAESVRRRDVDSVATEESKSESGFMAMFRSLFASFDRKAADSRRHAETGKRMMDDKRETEKVD